MEPRLPREEQIEKTIASIDGISKADAPPFFYTRLQAQLDKRKEPAPSFWMLVTKPAVSLATLALLVVLNVAAIRYYIHSSKQTTNTQSANGIQTFAEAYDLGGSSVFTDKTTDQ